MEFDCHAPIEMTTLQFRIFVIRMEPNYLYLIIYCWSIKGRFKIYHHSLILCLRRPCIVFLLFLWGFVWTWNEFSKKLYIILAFCSLLLIYSKAHFLDTISSLRHLLSFRYTVIHCHAIIIQKFQPSTNLWTNYSLQSDWRAVLLKLFEILAGSWIFFFKNW